MCLRASSSVIPFIHHTRADHALEEQKKIFETFDKLRKYFLIVYNNVVVVRGE